MSELNRLPVHPPYSRCRHSCSRSVWSRGDRHIARLLGRHRAQTQRFARCSIFISDSASDSCSWSALAGAAARSARPAAAPAGSPAWPAARSGRARSGSSARGSAPPRSGSGRHRGSDSARARRGAPSPAKWKEFSDVDSHVVVSSPTLENENARMHKDRAMSSPFTFYWLRFSFGDAQFGASCAGSPAPLAPASIGFLVTIRSRAGARAAIARLSAKELLDDPVLQRVKGDHRQPPARASSSTACGSAASRLSSSRLTAIRSAWNVRVAGWICRRPPSARATSSASSPVPLDRPACGAPRR